MPVRAEERQREYDVVEQHEQQLPPIGKEAEWVKWDTLQQPEAADGQYAEQQREQRQRTIKRARSRRPCHKASTTPEAPNPSSAVEMTRKPK